MRRITFRQTIFVSLMAALALVAAFVGYARPAAAANATIAMSAPGGSGRFTPNIATVNVGDTVTFTGLSGHTATDLNGAFNIAAATGTWVPTASGTYYFYCAVHSDRTEATEARVQANDAQVGKIVVQAVAQATAIATPAGVTPAPGTGGLVAPSSPTATPAGVTPAPAKTGTGGLVTPSSPTAAMLALAAFTVVALAGARAATRRR